MASVVQIQSAECPSCRRIISANAVQCPYCGQAFAPPDPVAPGAAIVFRNAVARAKLPPMEQTAVFIHGASKWFAIAWSGLCCLLAFNALLTVLSTAFSKAGGVSGTEVIAYSLGLWIWAGAWVAIAGPACMIALLTKPRNQ